MNNKMRRSLALALALLLLGSLLPAVSFAQAEEALDPVFSDGDPGIGEEQEENGESEEQEEAAEPLLMVAAELDSDWWSLYNTDNITVRTLTGTVDGATLTITHYTGFYAKDANNPEQQINIYVPSNARPTSAIYHQVGNAGWQSNNFNANSINDGFSYSTTGSINPSTTGLALKRGMVIVTYGGRSRANPPTDGEYLGHSPGIMTDTKAALRFLRYNYTNGILAGKGNPDWVFVTGGSGGGGLSVVLAASGDSPDYFPSLYEIGAAGVEWIGAGEYASAADSEKADASNYVSTISDAYFGTIAYCPIMDLPMADQAYEFTYNLSRSMRPANANVNGNLDPLAGNLVMQASDWLANDFVSYINGLGLLDENGSALTASYTPPGGSDLSGAASGSFRDAMQSLLERGLEKAIRERAGANGATPYSNVNAVDNLGDVPNSGLDWIEINGQAPKSGMNPPGTSSVTIYDFDRYLTDVPNSTLKTAPAFNNIGTQPNAGQNENNLYGSKAERFNQTHEWGWDHALSGDDMNASPAQNSSISTVGFANTGLTWDQFLQTDNGKLVALQMKMTSPVPYLVGAARMPYLRSAANPAYAESSDDCTVAPYWYVRHGQADRDTSYAVHTILYYALLNHSAVKDVNLAYTWRKPHGGSDDPLEAFCWLDQVLYKESTAYNEANLINNLQTAISKINASDGQAISENIRIAAGMPAGVTIVSSDPRYAMVRDGEIVIRGPPAGEGPVGVTLTAAANLSVAGDGVIYGDVLPRQSITIAVSEDILHLPYEPEAVLTGTVDSQPVSVERFYGETYLRAKNNAKQQINVYVPSNATPETGILFIVGNGGWQGNNFPTNTITDGFSYDTTGSSPNNIGMALKRGMVVVSYGCRSRNDAPTDGLYLGHSPATMTDTKAALRYLRYNYEIGALTAGNPDRIVITGTSGGGALSVIIAGSGNSPDYFPSLYEVGAAGVQWKGTVDYATATAVAKADSANYSSTVSDSVFGTIAYCPITDLAMADQAYEFTYNASRSMRAANAAVNGNLADYGSNPVMQASAWLANDYAAYINGLGLRDENGALLTATYTPPEGSALSGTTGGSFKDAMKRLLERGIEKAIYERNEGSGSADVVDNFDTYNAWLSINGGVPTAGNPATGSTAAIIDLDVFLTTIPNSALKVAPAFNNIGTQPNAGQNENDLYGSTAERFNQTHEWGWDHALPGDDMNASPAQNSSISTVGFDNTGLTWDQFLQTDNGKLVALQMKMTTPLPYLLGAARMPYLKSEAHPGYADTSDACDPAPYWYVRHGQADRDTSFAVGTSLYYALRGNADVKALNFNFAWRKPHGGTYDNAEAFEWLDEVFSIAEVFSAVDRGITGAYVTDSFVVPVGGGSNTFSYASSNEAVAKYESGQIVIQRPASGNASITLTITAASDIVAGDGVNYGTNEETRVVTFTVLGLSGGIEEPGDGTTTPDGGTGPGGGSGGGGAAVLGVSVKEAKSSSGKAGVTVQDDALRELNANGIVVVTITEKATDAETLAGLAAIDAVNRQLAGTLYTVGTTNNGQKTGDAYQQYKIAVDISGVSLTDAQKAKLSGAYYDPAAMIWKNLGGELSADGKTFTFYSSNAGDHTVMVSNNLIKLVFTIGASEYFLNGQSKTNDVAPFIRDGRTLIPVRVVAESLGAEVYWDQDTRTVTVTKDDKTVSLVIDQPLPNAMGTPVILSDRSFVPIRYLAIILECNIFWDNTTRSVTVFA